MYVILYILLSGELPLLFQRNSPPELQCSIFYINTHYCSRILLQDYICITLSKRGICILFAAIKNIYKCKLLLTWTSHNSSALCFPLTLFYLCPFFKKSCIIILLIHVVPILHATVYKTVRKQRNILRNRGIEGCRAALLLLRAPLFLIFF